MGTETCAGREFVVAVRRYWNIKECGDVCPDLGLKSNCFTSLVGGGILAICGTNVPPGRRGGNLMKKQRIERNLLFPSREFRDRVRSAASERGFRSEQAFILTACEHELREGDNTEATAQLEARIAATLANMAKEVQSLFTLVHTQFALTNSLLQYVLTCMIEPPEDVLPAARARARLRYTKILRLAAQEVGTRNKATLEEVLTGGKQQ
jgi:hypothetical protein